MHRSTAAARARLLREIEAMNVRAVAAHWSLVPPALAKRLRTRVGRIGDAILTVAADSDAVRMNRVVGLGHLGRAREPMIDEIIDFYREAGLRRFSLMMSPGPQAERITSWLLARGFERHGGHSMLIRPGGMAVTAERSDVRVVRAGREHMAAVIAINERCFAVPASRRGWTLSAMRAPGLEQYVAMVGRTTVAFGALRIDGDLAWLGMGATLTRWRRHGAHAALIAARLRRAARKGCRWVCVETMIPEPGRPAGSRRNLLRAGFADACEKPGFIWSER